MDIQKLDAGISADRAKLQELFAIARTQPKAKRRPMTRRKRYSLLVKRNAQC